MSTQDAYEAAREAAVERMLATVHANNEYGQDASQLYDGWGDDDDIRKLFRLVLGSALAVPECPDCEGATRWQCFGCRKRFDGDLMAVCPNCHREGYWTGSVKPCSSCGGSGQSRVRVRVAVVEEVPWGAIATGKPQPVFRALARTPEATVREHNVAMIDAFVDAMIETRGMPNRRVVTESESAAPTPEAEKETT